MTSYDRKGREPTGPTIRPAQATPATAAGLKPKTPAGGPLTRLAREAQRAQRGEGEGAGTTSPTAPNWTEVAQAISTKYHELEGKVTATDLLGAIRELPDDSSQDLVIGSVGGAHAEHLRRALRTPPPPPASAQPSAAALPTLRALKPASDDSSPANTKATGTAAQVAPGAASATQPAKAPVKTAGKTEVKASEAPPRPKLTLPQRSQPPASTEKQATAGKAQGRAAVQGGQTQGANPSGPSSKSKDSGAGKAGNLIVARKDDFKNLNVNIKPSMERGGRLVFSPAAWREAEKGVGQALKERQAPKTGEAEKTSVATQPETKPSEQTKAQKPQKLPSATIKADEMKRHEQQNRQKNQSKLKGVVAKANKARTSIAKAQPKATAQITAAQKGAEAQISAALQKTLGQIRSAEASAKSSVTARASAATAKVTSAHQATVQGIRQDTTQKLTALKTAAKTLKTKLSADKAKLDTGVTKEFNSTSKVMQEIGQNKATSARSTGQDYADKYRAEPLPEQNALQDLANGSDYPANKRAAKVQAALDVAKAYAGDLTKAGNDQASQIMASLPDALASNQTILGEYQKQLDTYLGSQVSALQQQQQAAINQANQQRSALLAQIATQRSQALSGIAQAAAQGRSQATAQANSKKQAVRGQGQQAIRGVASSVSKAQSQMQGRIQGFQQDMQGKLTLDAPDFAKAVSGFESYAQKGGEQAQAQVTRSASASAARVKAAAAPAAQALSSLGQSTASSLKAQATQAGTGLTALATGGVAGLKQALGSHQQATKATLTSATKQFGTFSESFGKDAQKTLRDVSKQLGETKRPFRQSLTDALDNEPKDIEAQATEAANAVQPRWKGVLKVLIDVVIVIATIAATVALAAVLGPVGLVLAGMAIGALGAVVGQGLKDAVDGKFSGWKTYGVAALGGAIGGAFGGAGGAVGNILAKGAVKGVTSGIGKKAMQVGVESTVGTAFDLAGQVATGYTNKAVFDQPYKLSDTFNVKNVAMSGVMNTAGTALASPSVIKFVGTKLGNLPIPGKGLAGKFQNTLAGSRPIQAINKLDAKITNSKMAQQVSNALERAGEGLGAGLGGKKPNLNTPSTTTIPQSGSNAGKNTPSKTPTNPEPNTPAAKPTDDPSPLSDPSRHTAPQAPIAQDRGPQPNRPSSNGNQTADPTPAKTSENQSPEVSKVSDGSPKQATISTRPTDLSEHGYHPQPGERATTKQEWQAQDRQRRIAERRDKAEQTFKAQEAKLLAELPEGPRKQRVLALLQQVDQMDFRTRPDQASVYSGAVAGKSNHELALDHVKAGGDAIDSTPGGKELDNLKLFDEFADDARLANLIWKRASMRYASGASGDIHMFIEGALLDRVFHTVEKPFLQSNSGINRWKQYPNPGATTTTTAPATEAAGNTPGSGKGTQGNTAPVIPPGAVVSVPGSALDRSGTVPTPRLDSELGSALRAKTTAPADALGLPAQPATPGQASTVPPSDITGVQPGPAPQSPAMSKLSAERTAEVPPQLSDLPEPFKEAARFETPTIGSWEELGAGGNKTVYGVSDQQVVGVLKAGVNPQALIDELDMLKTLKETGLPTVKAEVALVDGYPAIVMERMAEGSKGIVKLVDGKVRIVGNSPLLNEKSMQELQAIQQKMREDKIKIDDLQFLIGNDGHIVIADPLRIHLDTSPSRNNMRTIDLLIESARKNRDNR